MKILLSRVIHDLLEKLGEKRRKYITIVFFVCISFSVLLRSIILIFSEENINKLKYCKSLGDYMYHFFVDAPALMCILGIACIGFLVFYKEISEMYENSRNKKIKQNSKK